MQASSDMISRKDVNKMLKNMLDAMPDVPYIHRRRSPILAYVISGIGLAVVGGIAALFFFSPRTRTRALGMAKDTVKKVESKVHDLDIGKREPYANGRGAENAPYSSSGL